MSTSAPASRAPLSGESVTEWVESLSVSKYDLRGDHCWWTNPRSAAYLMLCKLCTRDFDMVGETPSDHSDWQYLVVLKTSSDEPVAFLALHKNDTHAIHCFGGSIPVDAHSFYCNMLGKGRTQVLVPTGSATPLISRTELIDYSGALLYVMVRAVSARFTLVACAYATGSDDDKFTSRGCFSTTREVLEHIGFRFAQHVCHDKLTPRQSATSTTPRIDAILLVSGGGGV